MSKIVSVLCRLLSVLVAVQFFLAAMGAFDEAPRDEAFAPHRALGYVILMFALAITIIAAAARLSGRLIATTGLVTGLVVLQAVISTVAGAVEGSGDTTSMAGKLVFGLHAVNAVVIVMMIDVAGRQAQDVARALPANDVQTPTMSA